MKNPKSEEIKRIVDTIYKAVLEQRLRAGTRLVEAKLTEALQANRNHVRSALLELSRRDIVTIEANRGAFVAQPTKIDAMEIFEARRIIQSALVHKAVERSTSKDVRQLQQHISKERKAIESGSREEMVRLSGEFHLFIARMAGNQRLTAVLENLIAASSLIVGMYERLDDFSSSCDAQELLLTFFEARNPKGAAKHIHAYLLNLESRLLAAYEQEEPDLIAILAP